MNEKLVVNIYGGPGSGKSTTAAGVFCLLKIHEINCELVTEFAKDLTWEERHKTLNNQFYILAKQYHKMWRLPDDIEVIITDSPIIFASLYSEEEIIKQMALHYFNNQNNLNFFLKRVKKYNPLGRSQTESEAKQIDLQNKQLLEDEDILYSIVDGNYTGANIITNTILKKFNKKPIVNLVKDK